MHTIRQILQEKGENVWTIGLDDTVYDAITLMATKGIGALVVMRDDAVHGMVSERDYARKVVLEGRSSRETLVSDICSSPAITISPRAMAEEGLALMTRKRVRHLPVADRSGQLHGLVSIGDLVNAIIGDQQKLIEQLERYVSGY
jgi:CBS domain-containing protein